MTSLAKAHRRITIAAIAVAATLLAALAGVGWWAAGKIDDRSIAHEQKAIRTGLAEIEARIPVEQDSSAIWSEAVVKLKAADDQWIADNLAEWMSEYFGHDRIYLLDAAGQVVRSVSQGALQPLQAYDTDRTAVEPLVVQLRAQMASASAESPEDSTAAIAGLGAGALVALDENRAAFVSIRPVLPSDDTVVQPAGTEYLHVSIVDLDHDVSTAIGAKFDIDDLRFERGLSTDPDRIALPVIGDAGRVVGFFTWLPNEPAYQLIAETGPMLALCTLFLVLSGALLIARLQRTTRRLGASEATATFLAYHDSLTRLPNRAMFEQQLMQRLALARETDGQVVLHYLDLDQFKAVNDTLGHPIGDELLVQAAARLGGLAGPTDLVARLGGDEFAIIQSGITNMHESLGLAQAIVSALQQPFDLKGHKVTIGASIGIMASDGVVLAAEDLMRQADLALYEAKAGGRNRYMLYGGELGEVVRDRLRLETDLRAALSGQPGLELVYQPIYCATSDQILGCEALVRWAHPSRGRLSPAVFIRLAEERGLINELGLWVLKEACRYAARTSLPWVAVNVSPIQFRDEHFLDRVLEILAETGLPASRLELEVTEGLLLQSSREVQTTLKRLREHGIRIALDDFGTGYSSISYLRTHGVDKLKIDQSFTAQLGIDPEMDSIVRSIIDLSRAMRMRVTAEGVETQMQRDILVAMGCDQLQGFLMSRPLTADGMRDTLARQFSRSMLIARSG